MPHPLRDRPWRCGRLEVHEYGAPDAPTLLLLHGLTDSGECWADLVERFGASYRILAPDALGHGRSDRFTEDELRSPDPMQAAYDALAYVLHHVGPTLVLGHSMGGGMAAALTAREPDLVRATVLEDPVWIDAAPWGDPDAERDARIAECRATAEDPDAAIAVCRLTHPTWPVVEMEPWARAKVDVDLDFLATGRAMLEVPWREIAGAVRRPTLVVTGDVEVLLNPSIRQAVAGLTNPALDVRVIEHATHCVRRDRGAEFHALVAPWLARFGFT